VRQRGRGWWGRGGEAYVSSLVGERLDCHGSVHQGRPPCPSLIDAVWKAGRVAVPASLSNLKGGLLFVDILGNKQGGQRWVHVGSA